MLKKRISTYIFTLLSLIYLEGMVRQFTFGSFDARFLYAVAFSIPLSAFFFMFTLFKNSIVFKIIYNSLIGISTLICLIQTVYFNIFGNFCSVSLISQGGAAITNFAGQTLAAIKESLLSIILLLLPLILSVLLTVLGKLTFENSSTALILSVSGSVILLHTLSVAALTFGGTGSFTPFGVYISLSSSVDASAQNFGCLSAVRRDAENALLSLFNVSNTSELIIPQTPEGEETPTDAQYNISSIDIEDFLDESKNVSDTVHQISSYMASRSPTKKNEYTGMFDGYNLITVCAESFSPYAISEELTPTLYKMSTQGFIFENFYGSFSSLTTNGEYTFQTGMFPDTTTSASFFISKDNALPFTLGNMFSEKGLKTYAYHNYLGSYFNRDITHPNLGYNVFKTPDRGLDIKLGWPSSDLDMIKASVDDYIYSDEQFHTYYMTFSGHYKYDFNNPMALKNYDAVKDLPYPEEVKAYLACNLELEYALEYLVQKLEDAGIADKTVIALANDHFPYGLTIKQYSALAGKDIDNDFEKYKNSFIIWSPSMEEPIKVKKLCSTIDILPTLLNLFGFEYDSRFVIGRDILSDCEGIAILANSSFITDTFRFNAENNKAESLTQSSISQYDLEEKQAYVSSIFDVSKLILFNDYYKYYTDYMNGEELSVQENPE